MRFSADRIEPSRRFLSDNPDMALFGFGKRRPSPAVPPDSRIYAVGDIHGRADLLEKMHKLIGEDAAKAPETRKCIIYLGDYIDRGLRSKDVIDILLQGPPFKGCETIHLKGNHEAAWLGFLDEPATGHAWRQFGGAATIASYGVQAGAGVPKDHELQEVRDQLFARMPPAHLAFLEMLETVWVEADYLFVHAGIRPGVPIEKQEERDLLWIREDFTESSADHGKIIVHGHSLSWEPETFENRIGIDTGAYATGVLTCLTLWGHDRAFLQTQQ